MNRKIYEYRGFMLDVCRHFMPVNEIKTLLLAAAELADGKGILAGSFLFRRNTGKGTEQRVLHTGGDPGGCSVRTGTRNRYYSGN